MTMLETHTNFREDGIWIPPTVHHVTDASLVLLDIIDAEQTENEPYSELHRGGKWEKEKEKKQSVRKERWGKAGFFLVVAGV